MTETKVSKGRFLTGPSVRAVRLLFKRMDPDPADGILDMEAIIAYFRDRLIPGDQLTDVVACLIKAVAPFSGSRKWAADLTVIAVLHKLGVGFTWQEPEPRRLVTAEERGPVTLAIVRIQALWETYKADLFNKEKT